MLRAKRRFLVFGDYRIDELSCDACNTPIEIDSEFFGRLDFSQEFGAQNNGKHYHLGCIDRLTNEQKIILHSSFFRGFAAEFELPEWHEFLCNTRPGEELRILDGFFIDSESGRLKKIVHCFDCGCTALLDLTPTQSDANPEITFFKPGSSAGLTEAPVCLTNRKNLASGNGRPSVESCEHEFLLLGKSGRNDFDVKEVCRNTRSALKSGEYDFNLMRQFGIDDVDVYQANIEGALGFSWYWCSRCGYDVRLQNNPQSWLPISGPAGREHGIPSFALAPVTQARLAGSRECKLDL